MAKWILEHLIGLYGSVSWLQVPINKDNFYNLLQFYHILRTRMGPTKVTCYSKLEISCACWVQVSKH